MIQYMNGFDYPLVIGGFAIIASIMVAGLAVFFSKTRIGRALRAVADIGTHWMDAVSFILGAKVESVFATLETFHKIRLRPKGEVQTFAKADRKNMVPYNVDTEALSRIMSCPAGAEATGLHIVDDMNGWTYIMSNFQHAGDWLPPLLASLDRPFVVERPDELRGLIAALASRLATSATG